MAIEGNVHTISLFEIFRIIAAGHYIGTLHVWQDRRQRSIWFAEGGIYSVRAGRDENPDDGRLLGKLLHTEGKVSMADLHRSLAQAQEQGRRIGEMLLENGHIDLPTLERVLRVQLQERLFETFLWDNASYKFVRGRSLSDTQRRLRDVDRIAVIIEPFVMQAAHKLDEWHRLIASIPSSSTILQITEGRDDEIVAAALERKLFFDAEIISGMKPISALFAMSGDMQVMTGALLEDMLTAGAVQPLSIEAATVSFREARARDDHAAALAFLAHIRDAGARPHELHALENQFFGSRKAARSGISGAYATHRSGVALVELAYCLARSSFPCTMAIRSDTATQRFDLDANTIINMAFLNSPVTTLEFAPAVEMPGACFSTIRNREEVLDHVYNWLERARRITSPDSIFAMSAKGLDQMRTMPIAHHIDGVKSVRRVIEDVAMPPRATFDIILMALEQGRIRALGADELKAVITRLLEEGRPTDALLAARAAADQGFDPPFYAQLIAAITELHGDLTSRLPEYHFRVEIGEVSLAEVFQSLHSNMKNGSMNVHGHGETRSLYFDRGALIWLGDESALAGANAPRGLAGTLINESDAPADLVLLVKDYVLDMFLWERASVEFVANVFPARYRNPSGQTLKLKLDSDRLFMEIVALITRVEEIRKHLSWESGVAFRSDGAREQARALPGGEELVPLIDELAIVDDLVAAAPFARFDTLDAIHQLFTDGLLRLLTRQEVAVLEGAGLDGSTRRIDGRSHTRRGFTGDGSIKPSSTTGSES